jgi:3-dehydroquinate synthase
MNVTVRFGDVHAHDVLIGRGRLADLGDVVARCAPAHRCAVIADATVTALHGAAAAAALGAAGIDSLGLSFPPGERSKNRAEWQRLTDALLQARCGRDTTIVALGGGVSGDLAGFVAATFMRGVPLVVVPTTLLAMVDAAIGGKTAVDVPAGKNLVGAFHPPAAILTDPDLLATLPAAELRQGFAEAVKHGAIADAAHLEWIAAHAAALAAAEPAALDDLVRTSVAIKAAVVGRDPWERGERASLNAGHTIAHALERCSGFAIPHGDAVAIGLVVEARAGEAAAITRPGTADALARVLLRLGLPVRPPGLATAEVLAATRTDKKGRSGTPRYALLRRPGAIARTDNGGWTFALDDSLLARALEHG